MMHGLEKSDLAIVAVKPANKGAQEACGVGGAKGGDQGKHGRTAHAVDSEPRIDVSQRYAMHGATRPQGQLLCRH